MKIKIKVGRFNFKKYVHFVWPMNLKYYIAYNMILSVWNHAGKNGAMCSGDILSSLRAPKGTQQPQMCHLLSLRMGLIDFLGGVGFDID